MVIRIVTLVVALGALGQASAAEIQADPKAWAKTIAPLVEERTVMVARVDLAHMDRAFLASAAKQFCPPAGKEPAPSDTAWRQCIDHLVGAGGREVYAVATLSVGMLPKAGLLLAIPLPPGAESARLASLVPIPETHKARHGNLLVAAWILPPGAKGLSEVLASVKPMDRPEIAQALQAVRDRPIQVVLVPPAYAARVIEETWPELPQAWGGGPSSVFTRGVRWVALGDLPPAGPARPEVVQTLSGKRIVVPAGPLRVVIQSQDAPAAKAFRTKLEQLISLAAKHPEIAKAASCFEARALLPEVQGDRLVLQLDQGERANLCGVLDAVLAATRTDAHSQQPQPVGAGHP